MAGTLYLVATPIGNREDITIRAIKTLFSVSAILCEDTRMTGNLIDYLGKTYQMIIANMHRPRLIPYHDHNEDRETPRLTTLLEQGRSLALVSDAGTPLLSDPGYPLVRECIKRSIPVVPIPGPSSILTALVASGLSPYPFLFLGYPPEKQGKRIKFFQDVKLLHSTLLFFASPHKVIRILEDFCAVFGDVTIVVARELTKVHEEFVRQRVSVVIEQFRADPPKGELVILSTSGI